MLAFLLIAMVGATSLFSQSSRDVSIIDSDIRGFDAIEVSSDFKAFIRFSDSQEEVRVEVDDRLADQVVIEKEGSTLIIKLADRPRNWIGGLNGNIKMDAFITTKYLKSIRGRSDAEITLENQLNHPRVSVDLSGDSKLFGKIQAENFRVRLASDSRMELKNELQAKEVELNLGGDSKFFGSLNAENLTIDLRSDSKAYIKGSSTFTTITSTGDSKVDGAEFLAGYLDISLKSDSDLQMQVGKKLKAYLTGDSDARLKGKAVTAKIEASDDSKVQGYELEVGQLDIYLRSDAQAYLTVTESIEIEASGDAKLKYQGPAVIKSQVLRSDSKVVKMD